MKCDRIIGHRHGQDAGNAGCAHEWGTQSENAAGPSHAVCLKCGFIPLRAGWTGHSPEGEAAIKDVNNTIRVRRELAEFKRRERQAARLRGAL